MRAGRLVSLTSAARARAARSGWIVLAAVVVALLVAGMLWYAPFLRLSEVRYSTSPEREAALREAVPVAQGQPLVEVDTDGVRRQALATGLFSGVRVRRVWPSTLEVEATPRTPVVAMAGPGLSGRRLVDENGVAYESVPQAPEGVLAAEAEKPGDPQTARALASVVTALPEELRGQVSDLRIDAAGRLTMDVDRVLVVWGGSEENRIKAAAVSRLAPRPGVARVDVSAPLAPVTSGTREEAPVSPGAGTAGRTSGAAGQQSPGSPATSDATRTGGPPTADDTQAATDGPAGAPTGTPAG